MMWLMGLTNKRILVDQYLILQLSALSLVLNNCKVSVLNQLLLLRIKNYGTILSKKIENLWVPKM